MLTDHRNHRNHRNKAEKIVQLPKTEKFEWSEGEPDVEASTQCLNHTQNVAFEFLILAFSTNFCLIVIDLSGNPV